MSKIFVPYGTTEGQTARMPEYMAEVIRGHGHQARGVDIKRSGDAVLDGCDAVIVGASIHLGKHEKYVRDFVRRTALERLPVPALLGKPRRPRRQREAESYVEEFEQGTGWRPAKVALLGAALFYTGYGCLKRHLMK